MGYDSLEYLNKLKEVDFEYFFKFKKKNDNFNELWRMKTMARESLKEWLIMNKIDYTIAENCANACSELVENGIKYSNENTEIYVLIRIGEGFVTVEIINETEENYKEILMKYFEDIEKDSADDLMEMYLKKVKSAVNSNHSQLGIIKILMETKGKLEMLDKINKDLVHIKLTVSI